MARDESALIISGEREKVLGEREPKNWVSFDFNVLLIVIHTGSWTGICKVSRLCHWY